MLLNQILIRKRLVSQNQIEQVAETRQLEDRKLGELLLTKGLIKSQDLEEAFREQYWRQNGFWVID